MFGIYRRDLIRYTLATALRNCLMVMATGLIYSTPLIIVAILVWVIFVLHHPQSSGEKEYVNEIHYFKRPLTICYYFFRASFIT